MCSEPLSFLNVIFSALKSLLPDRPGLRIKFGYKIPFRHPSSGVDRPPTASVGVLQGTLIRQSWIFFFGFFALPVRQSVVNGVPCAFSEHFPFRSLKGVQFFPGHRRPVFTLIFRFSCGHNRLLRCFKFSDSLADSTREECVQRFPQR